MTECKANDVIYLLGIGNGLQIASFVIPFDRAVSSLDDQAQLRWELVSGLDMALDALFC